jgi:hypothetical protein
MKLEMFFFHSAHFAYELEHYQEMSIFASQGFSVHSAPLVRDERPDGVSWPWTTWITSRSPVRILSFNFNPICILISNKIILNKRHLLLSFGLYHQNVGILSYLKVHFNPRSETCILYNPEQKRLGFRPDSLLPVF